MGHTIYFQAHENGDTQWISVDRIRQCFDPFITETDKSGFYLSYNPEEECHVSIAAEEPFCSDFSIPKPCDDLRFFEGMYRAGRTGNFVCMLPEGRFIVFDAQTIDHLPESMKEYIAEDQLRFEIAESVQEFFVLMNVG